MSRKLFTFLLSELKTDRIVCKKCKASSEMTLTQLSGKENVWCPACQADMESKPSLAKLAETIKSLQNPTAFDVEFVLPDDEPSGK